ncbi:hypothetical protein V6N13_092974 [Hibiscus sabdariffa]|uniref:Ornithine aminotransferase n=1 Tax=Hibiscus sabdariffa TaxID=183260 RepID=A0ABR2NQL7_9ROSI
MSIPIGASLLFLIRLHFSSCYSLELGARTEFLLPSIAGSKTVKEKKSTICIFLGPSSLALFSLIVIQRSSAYQEQAERFRDFYNDRFPVLTSMLPMNTGAEGVETALKLARKWGCEKKKHSQR